MGKDGQTRRWMESHIPLRIGTVDGDTVQAALQECRMHGCHRVSMVTCARFQMTITCQMLVALVLQAVEKLRRGPNSTNVCTPYNEEGMSEGRREEGHVRWYQGS